MIKGSSPQTSAANMKNKFDNGTPGPGSYETNQSSVINMQLTRKLRLDQTSKRNLASSPSNAQSMSTAANFNESV